MSGTWSWFLLLVVILFLFGGCTALAGDLSPWPPFLIWVAVVVPLKALNDRFRKVAWPIEYIFWSVILLIAINLVWLRYTP